MDTSILSSSVHHPSPFPARRSHRPAVGLPSRRNFVQCASRRDTYGWDFGGGHVDENMIVLRKRIHEMKLAERNYEPPSNWMEWEKQYYTSYDEDICQALGFLQTMLMNMRPGLAIGLMAMLTLSLPASTAMVLYHLVQASTTILAGMHVG